MSFAVYRQFRTLADEWLAGRGPHSSAAAMADHPAYRAIVALGPQVVPFLLAELDRRPDHWFLALRELTGADPVPPAARGHLADMARAWVEWGRANRLSPPVSPSVESAGWSSVPPEGMAALIAELAAPDPFFAGMRLWAGRCWPLALDALIERADRHGGVLSTVARVAVEETVAVVVRTPPGSWRAVNANPDRQALALWLIAAAVPAGRTGPEPGWRDALPAVDWFTEQCRGRPVTVWRSGVRA